MVIMQHLDDDGIHPWVVTTKTCICGTHLRDVMAKDDDKIWQHNERLKGISRTEVSIKPSPIVQPHYPGRGQG